MQKISIQLICLYLLLMGLITATQGSSAVAQPIQYVQGSPTSQPARNLKQPWPNQFSAKAVHPRIETQIEKYAVPVESEAMRKQRERKTFVAETRKLGSKVEEMKYDLEKNPDRFTLQRLGSIVQQINFMFGNYDKKLTPEQKTLDGYVEARKAVESMNKALRFWQQSLQVQSMAQSDTLNTDGQTEYVVQGYLKEAMSHASKLKADEETQEAFRASLKP